MVRSQYALLLDGAIPFCVVLFTLCIFCSVAVTYSISLTALIKSLLSVWRLLVKALMYLKQAFVITNEHTKSVVVIA